MSSGHLVTMGWLSEGRTEKWKIWHEVAGLGQCFQQALGVARSPRVGVGIKVESGASPRNIAHSFITVLL